MYCQQRIVLHTVHFALKYCPGAKFVSCCFTDVAFSSLLFYLAQLEPKYISDEPFEAKVLT